MIASVTDVRAVRPMAANIPDERVEPYIYEIEHTAVLEALGAPLFEAVENDPASYTIALEGGYYDGRNGRKWFAGLKKAIAYLVYARVVRNNSLNVTAFGAVLKNGALSEQADDAEIARTANECKSLGEKALTDCVVYFAEIGALDCGRNTFTKKFAVIGD